MEQKVCGKCGKSKDVSYFYNNKNSKDGLVYYCKECMKNCYDHKQYYKNNIERSRERYHKDIEKSREKNKQYYKDNKEKESERYKKIYQNNKKKINEQQRKYKLERRKNDIEYKITIGLRNRFRHEVIIEGSATKLSRNFLGCSIGFFKDYIEEQFEHGMTWDNYGRDTWHLDHIKPVASFDLLDEKEQKKCFHYTNFQPLWAEDNYKKGSFYEE